MSQKTVKTIHTYIQNDLAMVDFDYADSTGRYLSSIKEFDLNNNIVKEIGYRPDGLIENHYTNSYNEKNQRVEYSIFDDDDQLMESHRFDYDEAGKIIGEACYYAEMDDNDYTHYIYDENNLLIEKRNIDSDDELYNLVRFSYTDNLLTREEHINDDQKLESEKIFEYNADGKPITEIHIDHLEGDKRTIRNEYNEAGFKVKTLTYNKKDQLAIKTYYEFDEQGHNITLIDEDARGLSTTRYIFNEEGKMELQEKYNADEELLVQWKYDYLDGLLMSTTTFIRESAEEVKSSKEEDESEDNEDEEIEEYVMVKRITTENVYEFF